MKKRRLTAMLLCLCMTASTITPVLANEESADTEISLLTESPTEEIGGEFGDGLRWDFDADTGLLTISGTGTMPRNWNDAFDAPWYSYASQIKNLVIEEGVSSIAPYAFAEFYNAITTVELPSTLTSVHYTSFKGNSLQSFNIENGSNFYTDDGVLFFQKNDEITLLFYPCHKNEDTYTVPEGTTHINSYAFNFVNLDEIYLPDSLQIIYDYAFMGSIIPVINIPASVQSIDMPCFEDNMIQNFDVDENNSYYTAVDGVLYTKDMQQLIAYPTMNTNETFTIPEGITAFPEYIITMAHQIKNLYIPSSVQEIVYTASDLMGSSLKNVFVDNDNQYYSDIDGVLFNKDMTELICYPASKDGTEYIIPESTTTILEDAFCDADNLESVIFHENISSIEGMGFYSCSNMTGAYFYGDVPETFGWGTYPPPFASVPSTFVIYYLDGVGEWTSPTYRGYNTAIWSQETIKTNVTVECLDTEDYAGNYRDFTVTFDSLPANAYLQFDNQYAPDEWLSDEYCSTNPAFIIDNSKLTETENGYVYKTTFIIHSEGLANNSYLRKVRVAYPTEDGIIYSEPFEFNVYPIPDVPQNKIGYAYAQTLDISDDTELPAITAVIAAKKNGYYRLSVGTYTCDDDAAPFFYWEADSGEFQKVDADFKVVDFIPDGSNTVTVYMGDGLGYVASYTLNINQ